MVTVNEVLIEVSRDVEHTCAILTIASAKGTGELITL